MENNNTNNNNGQTPASQATGTLITTEPNLAAGMKPEKQVIASESDNSSRKIIILSITTGLFALLTIVLGIVLFLPKKDSPTSGIPSQSTTDDDSDGGYSHNIDINTVEGNEEVTEILNVLATNVEKNSTAIITNSNLEIFYVPEGFNTHINLRLSLSRTIATDMEKVKSILAENGYELVGEMPHASSAPMPTTYEYINKEKEIVCGIYAVTDKTRGENVYASCAKTSWTWLTEEEKALLSSLETAYFKKTNKYPEKMISLNIKIKDSEYKPYQTTIVSTNDGNSQFFRTSPYSEWQYFRTSLVAASCEEYNTEDLKKAYLGEICYNGKKQSTVQL